jgi:hypothetical protein
VEIDSGPGGVFAAADVRCLRSGGARAAAVVAADAAFSLVLAVRDRLGSTLPPPNDQPVHP